MLINYILLFRNLSYVYTNHFKGHLRKKSNAKPNLKNTRKIKSALLRLAPQTTLFISHDLNSKGGRGRGVGVQMYLWRHYSLKLLHKIQYYDIFGVQGYGYHASSGWKLSLMIFLHVKMSRIGYKCDWPYFVQVREKIWFFQFLWGSREKSSGSSGSKI